jgi:hypothetical protein
MSNPVVKRQEREGAAWLLIGAILLGNAGHWFITPIRHPGAPLWKVLIVAGQAVVGAGLWAHVIRLRVRARAADRKLEAAELKRNTSLRNSDSPSD